MKDIYELLNDINIDDYEFEEMVVSEFEKEKIKKNLKKSINQQKKRSRWVRKVAAVAITLGLSISVFGLTFPTYASNIPVIGDIFRFLDNERTGLYDDYKDYSTAINMTEESKGISVTINDAIYDGKTVTLTFSIETKQDLGTDPIILDNLDIKGATGMAGTSKVTKVDESHYVGIITASNLDLTNQEKAKVKWSIDSMTNSENQKEITGSWNFALALNATESNTQSSDSSVEQRGVRVNIEKISFTPMSFIVYFEQVISEQVRNMWNGVNVDIEIKDDLGNRYSGQGNGGTGDSEGYNISWSKTFGKLDPNATKLIITPHVDLWEYTSDNHGSVEIKNGVVNEISAPTKAGKGREEFVLDEIIIELEK